MTLTPKIVVQVIDVQRDFAEPDGALSVPDGRAVIAPINHLLAAVQPFRVDRSRDWHTAGAEQFQENGGPFPAHCEQNTHGAEFAAGLAVGLNEHLVNKGMRDDVNGFSIWEGDFDATGRPYNINPDPFTLVVTVGLAGEYCVGASARGNLDRGLSTVLVRECIRSLDEAAGETTFAELQQRGAVILDTVHDLLDFLMELQQGSAEMPRPGI